MSIAKEPWTRYVTMGSWFVQDADGKTIFIINRNRDTVTEPEPGTRVTKTVPIEHADASCQLVFAAPALLKALKGMVSAYNRASGVIDVRMILEADEAIALATVVKDGAEAAREHEAAKEQRILDAFKRPEGNA